FLHLRARRRLVVGDDRQGLERSAAEIAALRLLAPQQEAEVFGGAESPFVAAPDEIHPAAGIAFGKNAQQRLDVDALLQTSGEFFGRRRFRGGKEQRLEDAQVPPGYLRMLAGSGRVD